MSVTGPEVFLTRGISTKELLGDGTEFEIDEDRFSSDEDCFDDEASNSFREEFSKYCSIDDDEEIDISSLSIEDLKKKMTPVTEDGYVLKLELSAGSGPVIPPKSIVLIHYEAFVEGQSNPFDSTYMRNSPHKFILGAGRVLFGLNEGVATMRKGEIAKLWVHYSYAYGDMGCTPRIPECANILYNVEILSYFDCKDAIEFEGMQPDDQQKAPFEKVLAVCKSEHTMGNELFNNKKFAASAPRYSRAVKLLETVNAANEEDDKKRDSMLLKLYLNLSLCYLKLKKANRAICFSRKAIALDEVNIKALFRLGQAFELDGKFEEAKFYFLKAQKLEPYNEAVNSALIKLEKQHKVYNDWSKNFCQRMFQTNPVEARKEILSQESPAFVETIENKVEEFKASDDLEYLFPSTFTHSQVEVIKTIAESHGLCFFEKIHSNQKIIKIKKIANAD